jgi:septum formation inhibitor-activating ATPase MinD
MISCKIIIALNRKIINDCRWESKVLLTRKETVSYTKNMDTHEQEKLKQLIQELARLINTVLIQSPELRSAIQGIEEKGYRVDLMLASMTRILKKEFQGQPEPLDVTLTEFDQEFLKTLRIRLDGTSSS